MSIVHVYYNKDDKEITGVDVPENKDYHTDSYIVLDSEEIQFLYNSTEIYIVDEELNGIHKKLETINVNDISQYTYQIPVRDNTNPANLDMWLELSNTNDISINLSDEIKNNIDRWKKYYDMKIYVTMKDDINRPVDIINFNLLDVVRYDKLNVFQYHVNRSFFVVKIFEHYATINL